MIEKYKCSGCSEKCILELENINNDIYCMIDKITPINQYIENVDFEWGNY